MQPNYIPAPTLAPTAAQLAANRAAAANAAPAPAINNPLDLISSIGTALNLPSFMNLNNEQAQLDALSGARDLEGNLKRDRNSAAYQAAVPTGPSVSGGGGGGGAWSGTTGGNDSDQSQIDSAVLGASTSSLSGSAQGDKMYADVYGQKMQTLLDSINNLSNQSDIAKRNNQGVYDTNYNELNTTKANSDNSYKQSTTQNGQSYQTNKNTIADQASTGLRGLLRMLGAYGAGGSSAAEYLAPEAVANAASASRAGANQTYAVNQSGLDTNYGNYLNEDTNSRKKLTDWLSNENQVADKTSLTTKQSLLTQLADAAGNKSAYSRGSYATGSQPYIDQSKALSPQIDAMSGVASRTYDGTTPTYTAKSLASYIPTAAGTQVGTTATQDISSPYLSLLLSQQKKDNKVTQ